MKRVVLLLLLVCSFSYAQTYDPVLNKSYTFTTTGTGNYSAEPVFNRGINFYKLVFANLGAIPVAACNVQIQLSSDNFRRNITNYGSIPCNFDGASQVFQFTASYIRLNVDVYVPNSTDNATSITLLGFVKKP